MGGYACAACCCNFRALKKKEASALFDREIFLSFKYVLYYIIVYEDQETSWTLRRMRTKSIVLAHFVFH